MFPWLSTWLFHPWLAAGSAAVASPILIHILSRRRFRRVRWGAMEFLLDAYRRNRRRLRLESLILLTVRCLIVLLLALMVARPFVHPGVVSALLGAAPRTERIVLIDDSYSTGYRRSADETVFKAEQSAMAQLVRWFAGERPGDSFTVVRTSDPSRPVAAMPDLSTENMATLQTRIGELAVSDRASHMSDAIEAIARLIEAAPTHANVAVYVASDFQRRDWLPAAAGSGGEGKTAPSIIAPLARLNARDRSVSLALMDLGADRPANVAITALDSMLPQIVAGVRSRFEVEVANFSDAEVRDVELRVSTTDQSLPAIVVPRIGPYERVREPVEITFPSEGSDRVVAELAGVPDRLALDNRRALGVEVVPAVPILIVNGEPRTEPYRDEVFLLRTALCPTGRVASGNDVRVIDESQLDSIELRPFSVVVLANVYRIGDAAQRRIEQFVADGGGLFVFLGGQVDAALYNERLFAGGSGWLPAELGEIVGTPSDGQGVGIGGWDASHPVFRPFSGGGADLLRGPRFFSYYAVKPARERAATTVATRQDHATSKPVRPAARVLATLNDSDHSPLLLERRFGAGDVLLCTSAADLDWNQWGRDPSYVVVMLQSVQAIARSHASSGQVRVGESIRSSIDPDVFSTHASLRLPTYPVDPPFDVEARPVAGGGFALSWERTDRAGLYTFELARTSGGNASRMVAVNPDPNEGDLSRASPAEITDTLREMKFKYMRNLSAFSSDTSEARQELWWPLLLAVAALLLTEQGLARWFGARG